MNDIEFLNRYIDHLNRALHDSTSKNIILETHLSVAQSRIVELEDQLSRVETLEKTKAK